VGQALIIPTRAPAPTPSPAPSTTPLPGGVTPYVVQPGDTLFRIALRFKTTVSALQVANHLSGIRIYAGQTLVIPSPVTPAPTPVVSRSPTPAAQNTYIVQSGDTLFRLALRFGTTVAALQAANHLSGTTIYVGQVLSIP
jgi:LysM repeat protein